MNPLKFSFIALVAFIVALHFVAIGWFSIEDSRWMRVITAAVFSGMLLLRRSRNTTFLVAALLSFLVADIFTLSYQLDSSKDGFFIFHGLAYSLLFLFITRGSIQEQWSRFQKNYIIIASALCMGLLLYFGLTFRSEIHGIQHLIFFYFHGIAIIACLTSALGYNERQATRQSMLYLIAALGLIFADLTAFAAEYLKAEGFYYVSRMFYVIGLAGLVQFAYAYKAVAKPKAEEIFAPGTIDQRKDTAYHDH